MKRNPHRSKPTKEIESRRNLYQQVGKKSRRKIKARREEKLSIWYGVGLFGMIGWSVAIPTLIGVAIGLWIDLSWPSPYSWTLTLLFVGLILGCLNAWFWVQRESSND